MPDAPQGPSRPMRSPEPARPQQREPHVHPGERQSVPSVARRVEHLGKAAGNRAMVRLLTGKDSATAIGVQRVTIKKDMGGETIYENPDLRGVAAPTAAQKQFVATSYSLRANYDMTRDSSNAYVKVRIQFVDQPRGTNEFKLDPSGNPLLDGAGKPIPDPTYRRNIGSITEIKDKERIDFAKERCKAIGSAWDHYTLVSKEKPFLGIKSIFGIKLPEPSKVRLPLKFQAIPVFDVSASDVHTTIRLFGMGTEAKRSGAHPIDAGHWYMDFKKNYGDMNVDAIAAHEYGHLLGLPDEYSISNDQAHQMLHRSGGGGANADKELDRHTARQMVAAALWWPVSGRLNSNILKVGQNIEAAKKHLGMQLAQGLRKTWRDQAVRVALQSLIVPTLATAGLKKAVPSVVAFESGVNFSNITLANKAMLGFTADAIKREAMDEAGDWINGVVGKTFEMKGADKTVTKISTAFSQNIWAAGSSGAGAAQSSAVADQVVGTGAGGLLPKVPPSATLLQQLEALPAQWKAPGKGLSTAYTPAILAPKLEAAVKTAVSAGILPKVKTVGELYRVVLNLVETAASASASDAVAGFIAGAIRPKVRDQLKALEASINTEVDAIMGLGAGGIAAKSADPNLKALATSLHAKLVAQQNKASWKSPATLNPGTGSAGMDVKYTATSMMGTNNLAKEGFRKEMIDPVVAQFNANLKRSNEETFKAETR